ncbi:hypothetical protein [Vibrio parahaemolyticus]|uniref:hypothetical protein n=1 Tax=Vibrio parahaemolyticus TaxID=670 RepID=UPI001110A0B9|nr:hypothetical protein [Vibrio parahaemolyticus]TMX40841.1 hypothetical protein DA098_03150 [Vibrio parahaemolyticus]TMX79854.1 hypothetical protein DA094_05050 [Vibrio parahaemolyticus]
MTDQTKKTQETTEAKETNLATASSCVKELQKFVESEGVKLVIRLVPDMNEGELSVLGLHVENAIFPVENDAFANKLGSNLHELIENLLPKMMPQVTAITLMEMKAKAGEDCDCSRCRKRRDSEQSSDDKAESTKSESSESTESAPNSI